MPGLFSEIKSRYPNGASDNAIRSYLLTQKFIPQAADTAVKTYRETMELVSAEVGSYPTLASAKEDHPSMRQSISQTDSIPPTFRGSGRPSPEDTRTREFVNQSMDAQGNAALNDIKAALEGRTLRISGWVDKKGLRRLRRILDANEPLMEDDEDEPIVPKLAESVQTGSPMTSNPSATPPGEDQQ